STLPLVNSLSLQPLILSVQLSVAYPIVEIQIEGNVSVSGFKESMQINEFIDEFTNLLESKGWSFGGEIKHVSTPIDKE
ncbi:hypothetical protein ACPCXF_19765, partial [Lysinibacillus agricola]